MLVGFRSGMMKVVKREPSLPRSYMRVTIPSDGFEFRLNFAGSGTVVDWGDDSVDMPSKSPAVHTYTAGSYDIEISDLCTRFECPVGYGRTEITEVGFGTNVTSIADGGYRNATSLVKIACAPSVSSAVNNTFNGCTALDWICDFSVLSLPSGRVDFLPVLNHQITHVGRFAVQQVPIFYDAVMSASPYDMMDLLPALTSTKPNDNAAINYHIRRVSLPEATVIARDSFLKLPNLYGVYSPSCTKISACITRSSSSMNNNPLGVTHMRLGHLASNPDIGRVLCWNGSENYLGVFMVDMTRAELSDWLSNLSVANFISQNAFEKKAICTDDAEWNTWNAWFEGGMEVSSAPAFPLDR